MARCSDLAKNMGLRQTFQNYIIGVNGARGGL